MPTVPPEAEPLATGTIYFYIGNEKIDVQVEHLSNEKEMVTARNQPDNNRNSIYFVILRFKLISIFPYSTMEYIKAKIV